MNALTEQLGLVGIIPVVVIEDEILAPSLARALREGGLTTMEVTLRTDAARGAISRIAAECPEMLLGAGTVLTIDQAKMAVDSGAQYIVSPGFNRKVVDYCKASNVTVIPGVASPTDIGEAFDAGLRVVKFFPAEASGGLEYLKAISAPFGQMMFVPTGGIDETNLLPYLQFPRVLACGGSWMVKADLISGKRFEDIQNLTARAMGKMLGFRLSHIGINGLHGDEATRNAQLLSRLFNLPFNDGEGSVFVGKEFELLKRPFLGNHGHIAVGTNFIGRAMAFLRSQGVGVKEETASRKDGKLVSVYLDVDIGGFAVHLLQL